MCYHRQQVLKQLEKQLWSCFVQLFDHFLNLNFLFPVYPIFWISHITLWLKKILIRNVLNLDYREIMTVCLSTTSTVESKYFTFIMSSNSSILQHLSKLLYYLPLMQMQNVFSDSVLSDAMAITSNYVCLKFKTCSRYRKNK